MTRHQMKILPQYFEAQINGLKNFELRKNDRDFKSGDEILLQEIKPRALNEKPTYTGRTALLKITYILGNGFEGLEDGHVILSTRLIDVAA